jgi:hypothetical protein
MSRSSAGARLRKKLTITSAPFWAKYSAIARPIPRPEPVTRAILLVKGQIFHSISLLVVLFE